MADEVESEEDAPVEVVLVCDELLALGYLTLTASGRRAESALHRQNRRFNLRRCIIDVGAGRY